MRRIATVAWCGTVAITVLFGWLPMVRGAGVGIDPPRVVVHGVDHFSAKQVTLQLDRALWFQAVYGAAYGWSDPAITLPHMTVEAYRKAGFRDATVHAHLPEGQHAWLPLAARDLGRNLFPADSWHHDAAMALLSSWAGSRRMADYYWKRVLTAPDAGPIRDVIAATQLQQKEPQLAHHLSVHGLGLLDLSGFHRDRDALLDESAYLGRFLVHATEVLRSAEPEGLNALLMHFPDAWEPGLTAALIHLRFHRDQPTWQTLPEALDSAWESHWKALVEARLKAIEVATHPKPK